MPTPAWTSCLIAAVPRTGSWLMAEALNNTALAGQPEEYFRPDHTHLWARRWGLSPYGRYDAYVEAAIRFSTTDNGVFSAKLHWYQFAWLAEQLRTSGTSADVKDDAELMERWFPRPRYLFLRRRDKVRQAISYYRAARSNVWFVVEGDERGAAVEDEAPDFQAVRWLEEALVTHEAAWQLFFDDPRVMSLEVIYEDFVADYDATVRKVLAWLEIPGTDSLEVTPPALVKQADDRTEEWTDEYLKVRELVDPRPSDAVWEQTKREFRPL